MPKLPRTTTTKVPRTMKTKMPKPQGRRCPRLWRRGCRGLRRREAEDSEERRTRQLRRHGAAEDPYNWRPTSLIRDIYVFAFLHNAFYPILHDVLEVSYVHVHEGRQRRLPTLRLEEPLSSSSQYVLNGMVNRSLPWHGTTWFHSIPKRTDAFNGTQTT